MSDVAVKTSGPLMPKKALWPACVVLLVMGFALFGDRGVLHLLQLHQQKESLDQDLLQIERQNSALRKEIAALRSDRRYIERVARTELGMVREDELVFQFAPRSHP